MICQLNERHLNAAWVSELRCLFLLVFWGPTETIYCLVCCFTLETLPASQFIYFLKGKYRETLLHKELNASWREFALLILLNSELRYAEALQSEGLRLRDGQSHITRHFTRTNPRQICVVSKLPYSTKREKKWCGKDTRPRARGVSKRKLAIQVVCAIIT